MNSRFKYSCPRLNFSSSPIFRLRLSLTESLYLFKLNSIKPSFAMAPNTRSSRAPASTPPAPLPADDEPASRHERTQALEEKRRRAKGSSLKKVAATASSTPPAGSSPPPPATSPAAAGASSPVPPPVAQDDDDGTPTGTMTAVDR